jgi:hypothetical protein
VSVGEGGGLFYADQVWLTIERSSKDRILALVDRYDFTVLRTSQDTGDEINLLVRVPIGGAKAAQEFFREETGVQNAALVAILTGQ